MGAGSITHINPAGKPVQSPPIGSFGKHRAIRIVRTPSESPTSSTTLPKHFKALRVQYYPIKATASIATTFRRRAFYWIILSKARMTILVADHNMEH